LVRSASGGKGDHNAIVQFNIYRKN
jgi:hypothetical protein